MKGKRDFPHVPLSLASTANVSLDVAFVGPSMLAESEQLRTNVVLLLCGPVLLKAVHTCW